MTPEFGVTRKRMFAVAVMLGLGIAVAYGLIAWTLGTAHQQAAVDRRAICAAEIRTDKALRGILVLARDQTLQNPVVTAAQRAQALRFYASALHLVVEPVC